MMGNLVFIVAQPLGPAQLVCGLCAGGGGAWLGGGRGCVVGHRAFASLTVVWPIWIVVFAVLGAAMLGTLGLIAGLWADKFDQMSSFQNFLITPMTFLSGVFIPSIPCRRFGSRFSHLNPFFYMIDGFRYGFFGVSDVSPWLSLALVGGAFVLVAALALHLLRIGYKIRG
jgi:ABC-2 type transport system permease protein